MNIFRILLAILALSWGLVKILRGKKVESRKNRDNVKIQENKKIKDAANNLKEKEQATQLNNEKNERFLADCRRFAGCKDMLEHQYQAYHACLESIKIHEMQKQKLCEILNSKKLEIKKSSSLKKNNLKKEYNQYVSKLEGMEKQLADSHHKYKEIFDNVQETNKSATNIANHIRKEYGVLGEDWYKENYKQVEFVPLPSTVMIGQQEHQLIIQDKSGKWQLLSMIMFIICMIILIKTFLF
ncbi:hypothetical protein [Moraxella catarrhalis]|uniref:hypothetical protein n=1 Tax=Moraxella catarrhalis TaxID=480 RepID=UPI0013D3683F|nr:hypothetical protein [Moraxella catarrhalis]